jgi:hypothetical protein
MMAAAERLAAIPELSESVEIVRNAKHKEADINVLFQREAIAVLLEGVADVFDTAEARTKAKGAKKTT